MAFFEDVEEFFRYEFSATDSGVEFEFSNGMINMVFPKDFFARTPEIHQYFNAYDAINNMDAHELERLRELIAPDIERLNLELEEENKRINRKTFEQMTKFREEVREINKKHAEEISALKQKINLTQESLSKSNQEKSDANKMVNDLNRQVEMLTTRSKTYASGYFTDYIDYRDYQRKKDDLYYREMMWDDYKFKGRPGIQNDSNHY